MLGSGGGGGGGGGELKRAALTSFLRFAPFQLTIPPLSVVVYLRHLLGKA